MIGMFCSAVIGALQAGQAERGTTRLNRSLGAAAELAGMVAAWSVCSSSAHCSRHWRSIMMGTRWMTTLRKLPTIRPSTRQQPMKNAGEEAMYAITDMAQLCQRKRRAERGVVAWDDRR